MMTGVEDREGVRAIAGHQLHNWRLDWALDRGGGKDLRFYIHVFILAHRILDIIMALLNKVGLVDSHPPSLHPVKPLIKLSSSFLDDVHCP